MAARATMAATGGHLVLFGQTNRRAFVAGLGGAAAWTFMAHAAQQINSWRVGYLSPVSATKRNVAFYATFRTKLEELGYLEGQNLRLDVRRADDDPARLPGLAAELVALTPNAIVATANDATSALQRATSTIPIVMATSNDPVVNGFVKSLAKPGGNITGMSTLGFAATGKTLELLHSVVPNASRIAVLMSNNVSHEALLKETYSAAGSIGVTIIPVMARTPADLDQAFAKMHEENCEAVLVLADARTNEEIVELANKWRLPAIFQVPDFVYLGGLLSYGADVSELFREAAVFIDKILKGTSPGELPVEQATKLLLGINLKTAKALGIEISPTLLARADEVIE